MARGQQHVRGTKNQNNTGFIEVDQNNTLIEVYQKRLNYYAQDLQ